MLMFRITITYTGKYEKTPVGNVFLYAANEQDAGKETERYVKSALIQNGFVNTDFKMEIRRSSMEEAQEYAKNLRSPNHDKMVN